MQAFQNSRYVDFVPNNQVSGKILRCTVARQSNNQRWRIPTDFIEQVYYSTPDDDGGPSNSGARLACSRVTTDALQEAQSTSLFSFFVPHFGWAIEMPPSASFITNTGIYVIVDMYLTTRFKLYGYRTNYDEPNNAAAT